MTNCDWLFPQDLSRSINGDAKTEVQPLFRIQVVLQMNKVEFKPSIADLTQTVRRPTTCCEPWPDAPITLVAPGLLTADPLAPPWRQVNSVSKEAIATTSSMPRLTEALQDGKEDDPSSDRPSFYVQISNDEDILKVLVQVMTGMREILPKLQRYLNTWDRYKHIWDVDKDAFMRRYAKVSNRPPPIAQRPTPNAQRPTPNAQRPPPTTSHHPPPTSGQPAPPATAPDLLLTAASTRRRTAR